ncbi:MAG: hypothetical protein H0W72_07940 [Planctomycetes bacterium]|nr:hypothetical protein [Planctomycetota bacterium]
MLRPDPTPLILRPGGLAREELERLLGEPVALAGRDQRAGTLPMAAPGMLASHYAPLTPLTLRKGAWPVCAGTAYLAFRGDDLPEGRAPREILSTRGDLAEAAANLFAAMRRLDASGATAIVAEAVPDQGLGVAINDRLRRAAGLG